MLPGAVVFFVGSAALTIVLAFMGKVDVKIPVLCLTVAMLIQVLGK